MMVGGLERCSTILKLQEKEEEEEEADYDYDYEKITTKKRTRKMKTPLMIKCLFSGEKKRCIYLHYSPKYSDDSTSYLCRIPATWLSHTINDNLDDIINKKRHRLHLSFNHYLHHNQQPSFIFPPETTPLSVPVPPEDSDDDDKTETINGAAWAVIGSTIYFFGGDLYIRNIYYLRNAGSTFTSTKEPGNERRLRRAGCMLKERCKAKVVALDGKVYVFGGLNYHKDKKDADVWAEVFEPNQGSPKGQCRALSSPSALRNPLVSFDFAVAVEKVKKIVVCWLYTNMYQYDIVGDAWVKIDIDFSVTLRSPLCRPLAVDGILYWLDDGMLAYDLDNKLFFSGAVEDISIQSSLDNLDFLFGSKKFQVSLLHLSGDFFCIVWVEPNKLEILHCTTVRVRRNATKVQDKKCNLRAIVLSCQTFVSEFPLKLNDCALML